MGDFVVIEQRGRIAILTLRHADVLNAVTSLEDCDDMVAAIERIDQDDSISVAILTGEGRAFSAGGNIRAMKERTGIGPQGTPAATRLNYRRGVQRIPRAFQNCEVPIIAAVNGFAIGLGCDLACFCDIRIAAESASFASSFIKLGLVPGDGGAWALPRAVGFAKAAEMMLTGDTIRAAEALAIGLVSRVVSDDKLLDQALAIADRIAANPPRSIRVAKRLLVEAQDMRLDQVLEMSAAYQALVHETPDHFEAVDAFLEKRKPAFEGR